MSIEVSEQFRDVLLTVGDGMRQEVPTAPKGWDTVRPIIKDGRHPNVDEWDLLVVLARQIEMEMQDDGELIVDLSLVDE